MTRGVAWAVALTMALAAGSLEAGEEPAPLWVTAAWVRAIPSVAQVTAGYMVVDNHDDLARTLVGARSPWFGHVSLHRTVVRDGLVVLEPQGHITIPARSRLEFRPGSYNLMLRGPRHSLNLAEEVPVILELVDGTEVHVAAPVRQADDGHGHAH